MSKQSSNEPRKSHWSSLAWLLVVLLMPLLYVLSVGPAALIAVSLSVRPGPDWILPIDVVNRIYFPLEWFAYVTDTTSIMEVYIEWWLRLRGYRP